MLGSAGLKLALRPKANFSSRTDVADRIVPLEDTAQKIRHQHVMHSIALSTDTDNTCLPKMGPP